MYDDLYLDGKALVERENVGFDLTKSDLCPSFIEDVTAKGAEEEYKEKDFDKVLRHINDFEHNISVLNEEVRMVQHQYKTPNDERDSLLEETKSSFVKKLMDVAVKSERGFLEN
ncbi:hypothetical protein Tco_1270526 [Tanacetum coccineum]